jgi:hypothetical protein
VIRLCPASTAAALRHAAHQAAQDNRRALAHRAIRIAATLTFALTLTGAAAHTFAGLLG